MNLKHVTHLIGHLIGLFVLAAPSLVACQIGETNYETVTLPIREVKETRTCEAPFIKVDPSTLKACKGNGGTGHCYSAKKSPIAPSELPPCDDPDEVCVPDKVLRAGGEKLKSCKFFIEGKPGACVSRLLGQIEAHKDELQPDVCDPDERCAPCIDVRDGSDAHVCDPTGIPEKDCTGGTADEAETCCHGAGYCMNRDGVPADQRDEMGRDTCSDDKQVCAPAAMIDGAPVKCTLAGLDGVCLDVCFNSILKSVKGLIRASCGPTEVCVPCVFGEGEGMPGCN